MEDTAFFLANRISKLYAYIHIYIKKKKHIIPNVAVGMVRPVLSYVAGDIANWSSPSGKQFGNTYQGPRDSAPPPRPQPSCPTLGIHSKKTVSNTLVTPVLFKTEKKKN